MTNDLRPGGYFDFNASYRGTCPRCGTGAITFTRLFPDSVPLEQNQVMVLRCEHCLRAFSADVAAIDPERGTVTFLRRFYPAPGMETSVADFIPEGSGIADALSEAALCRSVGATMAGCLVARRALQLITRHEGATAKNLAGEIDSLKISGGLKTIAHSVRLIGNEAAHPEPHEWDKVTDADLEALIGLAQELVRQLYEVPGQVERLRRRTMEISGHDPAAQRHAGGS